MTAPSAVTAAGELYGHLTSDDLPEPPGWCPPIPTAVGPDIFPPVADPSPEPLVDAADRFMWLNAYQPVYPAAAPGRLRVRATVADQLTRAQAALPAGYGLAVFDAWRPLGLQQALYDDAYANPNLPEVFVAPPSTDPAFPPPHLTGGAVDVTLTWRGRPLALGTAFDDFTNAAHTAALETTPGRARGLRRLLRWALTNHSFVNHPQEWWHWEWGTGSWAAAVGHPPLYGPAEPARC